MTNNAQQRSSASPVSNLPAEADSLRYIDLTFSPEGSLCVSPYIREDQKHAGRHDSSSMENRVKPFPYIGSSLFMRAIAMAERFWQEHQRCLATCLLLSPGLEQWQIGLPRQRAGHQGVSWALAPEDAGLFPKGCHIAGSWQYAMDATLDEIESMMPAFPGVHFVSALGEGDEPRSLWAAIRVKDQLRPVNPFDITADDTEMMLDQAMDRITLV